MFLGRKGFRGTGLALDFWIQKAVERITYEIRWFRPTIASLPLNKVHDELGDLVFRNDDKAIWILDLIF